MDLPAVGWAHVPEFGRREPGIGYDLRRGAYAVVFGASGKLAVVRNPRGAFLPGGGIDAGESPEAALQREMREECQHELAACQLLGEATQLVHDAGNERGLLKHGVFFVGAIGPAIASSGVQSPSCEDALCWLAPRDAIAALTHEYHVWVAQRVSALADRCRTELAGPSR